MGWSRWGLAPSVASLAYRYITSGKLGRGHGPQPLTVRYLQNNVLEDQTLGDERSEDMSVDSRRF